MIGTISGLERYEFTVGHGSAFDPEQVARLNQYGIETVRFPLIRHYNPVTAVPAVFSVVRYLHDNDFDIVHTNSTEAGIIGRFAAALADVPNVVHTVHGVPFTEDRNRVLNRLVLICERGVAPLTDCILTNADAITEEYLSRGIGTATQYRTVYSGIEIDRFWEAQPATDITGGEVRLLMVSRLVDGKGFGVLFNSIERIDTDGLMLYIVGDGPLQSDLRAEIADRGLEDTIQLLGYRNDIPEIMAACDVFVLPSFREGTPRVITEAMASGMPVISTEIAGIPEQVAHLETGYLVQPGDVEYLAECLDKLCSSPELRDQFGEAARHRSEQFTIEQMRRDTDKIYQNLLKTS